MTTTQKQLSVRRGASITNSLSVRRFVSTALASLGMLAAVENTALQVKAADPPRDPFENWQVNYTPSAYLTTDTNWGTLVGATSVDNGGKAVVLQKYGLATFFTSDGTERVHTNVYTSSDLTGITEVSTNLFGLNANIAISDITAVYFYSGYYNDTNASRRIGLQNGDSIRSIAFDPVNVRMMYIAGDGKLKTFDENGNSTVLDDVNTYINPHSVTFLKCTPEFTHDLVSVYGSYYRKVNADGTIDTTDSGLASNDMGFGASAGMAITRDKAIIPDFYSNTLMVYDTYPCKDGIDFRVERDIPTFLITGFTIIPGTEELELKIPPAYQAAILQAATTLTGGHAFTDVLNVPRFTNAVTGEVTLRAPKGIELIRVFRLRLSR